MRSKTVTQKLVAAEDTSNQIYSYKFIAAFNSELKAKNEFLSLSSIQWTLVDDVAAYSHCIVKGKINR